MKSALFECFRDEVSAYRFVEECVWLNEPKCPHCMGWRRIGRLQGGSTQMGTYKCYHCRKLFTVKTGTIFASSHIPLHKWLQAIYLCGCGIEPIKPQQLSDILNVTFKTSVFMISRLRRAALQSGLIGTTVTDACELDEGDPLPAALSSDVATPVVTTLPPTMPAD